MTFSASQIGFVTKTLTDPTTFLPSKIGFVTKALTDPSTPAFASSPIGFVTATLTNPPKPVAVLTATGLKYVPVVTWDGSFLR